MIDTNVRNVKKLESGMFSALTKPQKLITNLCDRCSANPACKIKSKPKRIKEITAIIAECSSYQWPIAFRDALGTDDHFNTMRMGKAWYNRISVGDSVGLIDKEGKVFGNANVERKDLMKKEEAMWSHGYRNHLMIGRTQEEAANLMPKILRNSYGNIVYTNNHEVSIIYLQRID